MKEARETEGSRGIGDSKDPSLSSPLIPSPSHPLTLSPPHPLTPSPSPIDRRPCRLYVQGITPYAIAHARQKSLVAKRKENPSLEDILILLEHPPVYTLGQGATLDFLKFDPSQSEWEVCRIERGER